MSNPDSNVAREVLANLEDCLSELESLPSYSYATVGEEEPGLFHQAWDYIHILQDCLGDTL